MGWRYGLSGTTPALQAQSHEFKPQPHKKILSNLKNP
jgi:hypothetical protein